MTLTLGKQAMTFTAKEIERLKAVIPSFHEGGNIQILTDEECELDSAWQVTNS